MIKKSLVALTLAACCAVASAEEIRIATYNIENWKESFDSRQVAAWAKKQPKSEELTNLVKQERNQDDEDNWEVASVLSDPKLAPDIVVFQEGCSQDDLAYFNKRWLNNQFQTLHVFPSNSGRGQNIGIMLKPGFEILETREAYHDEKDPVRKDFLENGPEEGEPVDKLFARGPGFVKVKSPSGYVFWVGTNHQKSKYGNSVDVAKWRLREAHRTHEIITELEKTDTPDVVFGGDMNDELGYQEFEQEAGGDAISTLVGKDGKVLLATRPLADKGEISYGGYWRPDHRSLIDHWFVSKSLGDRIASVTVFKDGLAPVASDHYPVLLVIKSK